MAAVTAGASAAGFTKKRGPVTGVNGTADKSFG